MTLCRLPTRFCLIKQTKQKERRRTKTRHSTLRKTRKCQFIPNFCLCSKTELGRVLVHRGRSRDVNPNSTSPPDHEVESPCRTGPTDGTRCSNRRSIRNPEAHYYTDGTRCSNQRSIRNPEVHYCAEPICFLLGTTSSSLQPPKRSLRKLRILRKVEKILNILNP